MTFEKWLSVSVKLLSDSGISSARLDCLIIAENFLGKNRTILLAHPETTCKGPDLSKMNTATQRRSTDEPLAYILGHSEFYGRTFKVDKNTLQPRTESEAMIELLLQLHKSGSKIKSVIDVGTGTGCLAITSKLELPDVTVLATDISSAAREVARKNANKLEVNVEFYKGNLLDPIPPSTFRLPTAILANLPYVPDSYSINKSAKYEPELALFGGADGLDLYRRLFSQMSGKDIKFIITESLESQHQGLEDLAKSHDYRLKKTNGLAQLFILV